MSSLAVVFFLRPFLGGILTFRIIVETVCKLFTLFHSKWETKLRYQGQLNHLTPRMTKQKILCCILPHVPWLPLHPTISPSLKRKRICYSFISFKMVHFSMVTSQKHLYTNKPASQYSFIIADAAILMAREDNYIKKRLGKVKRRKYIISSHCPLDSLIAICMHDHDCHWKDNFFEAQSLFHITVPVHI